VALSTLSVGDLVITEVMQNPAVVADNVGEWFEILNTTGDDVLLDGLTVTSSTVTVTLTTTDVVVAGGRHVLGVSADPLVNGGAPVDLAYPSSIQLGNGSDDLAVGYLAVTFDAIAWDDGATFPDPNGSSMSLDPGSSDAVANNVGANWCFGSTAYGDGDLGSPGAVNPACPVDADGDGFSLPADCDDNGRRHLPRRRARSRTTASTRTATRMTSAAPASPTPTTTAGGQTGSRSPPTRTATTSAKPRPKTRRSTATTRTPRSTPAPPRSPNDGIDQDCDRVRPRHRADHLPTGRRRPRDHLSACRTTAALGRRRRRVVRGREPVGTDDPAASSWSSGNGAGHRTPAASPTSRTRCWSTRTATATRSRQLLRTPTRVRPGPGADEHRRSTSADEDCDDPVFEAPSPTDVRGRLRRQRRTGLPRWRHPSLPNDDVDQD
jgi:hypothetical protein